MSTTTGQSGERAEEAERGAPQDALARTAVLDRYMAQKGLKSTRQRATILEVFFDQGGHVSVDELLVSARQKDPKVSTATVYRTMKLLVESVLAHARHFGDGQTRYERAVGRHHHDHLICTSCTRIIEFENDRIEVLQQAVARKHGFRVTDHKMELYGLCRECQADERTRR